LPETLPNGLFGVAAGETVVDIEELGGKLVASTRAPAFED
jgi:hypothetical protein